jgi:hypothetical protein
MNLLLSEIDGEAEGFRHAAPQAPSPESQAPREAVGRERWVINKIRALCSWYTKGFDNGAQFRIGVNSTKSIAELTGLIERFFLRTAASAP